jgi:mono/diheme cytochrome c family protein
MTARVAFRLAVVIASAFHALGLVRASGSASQTPSTPPPSAGSVRAASTGVYTEAQATRGAKIYVDTCQSCHGKSLEGDIADPLAGSEFLKAHNGQDLSRLYLKILQRMPDDAPGTLTPQVTADVLAYILKFNAFPAGKDELPADPERLKLMKLDSKSDR